jgi:hypothetical protein
LLWRISYSFDDRTRDREENCDRSTERPQVPSIEFVFQTRTIDYQSFQHATYKKGIKERAADLDLDAKIKILIAPIA